MIVLMLRKLAIIIFCVLFATACSSLPTGPEFEATNTAISSTLADRLTAIDGINDVYWLTASGGGGVTDSWLVFGYLEGEGDIANTTIPNQIADTIANSFDLSLEFTITVVSGDTQTTIGGTVSVLDNGGSISRNINWQLTGGSITPLTLTQIAATPEPFYPTLTPNAR